MPDQVVLTTEDFAAFTMDPENPTKQQPVLEPAAAQWEAPPRPDFEGTPTVMPNQGESNSISVVIAWQDLRIDIRANLLEKIVGEIERAIRTASGQITTGNPADAISTLVRAIQALLSATERQIVLVWSFKFKLDPPTAVDVYITNTADYSVRARNIFETNPDKLVALYRVDVDVDGDNRQPLMLFEHVKLNDRFAEGPNQKPDVKSISGPEHLVLSTIRLNISFQGYKDELAEMLDALTDLAGRMADLSSAAVNNVVAGVQQVLNDLDLANPPDLSNVTTETELRRKVRELVDAIGAKLAQRLEAIFDSYEGLVNMFRSSVALTCVTPAAAARIRRQIQTAPPRPEPDETQKTGWKGSFEEEEARSRRVALVKPNSIFPDSSRIEVAYGFAKKLAARDEEALSELKRVEAKVKRHALP